MIPALYLKLAGLAVVLIAIGSAYWWISSAFDERDKLRISYAEKVTQVQQYQESIARDIKFREGVNDAISKIRVTSNVKVNQIDSQPPPNLPDGTVVQLVSGGLPQMSGMPTFTNVTASSRSTVTQAD